MTETQPVVGTIGWMDLTVDDADSIRDFYSKVVGWKTVDVPMGEYNDYCMVPPESDDPIAGVCHRQGPNEKLPAQWLMYVTVSDLDESQANCEQRNGKILVGPRDMGSHGRICVIEDPAGAVLALVEPKK